MRHVAGRDPLRVVLGRAPAGARVHPCLELSGDLGAVLDELGRRGVLQLLVEGGPTVAHAFHAAGLVDRYVVYLAPAVFGGDDALGLFRGPAAPSIDVLPRGTFTSVCRLGDDVRVGSGAWNAAMADVRPDVHRVARRRACRRSSASSAASATRATSTTRPTWRCVCGDVDGADEVLVRVHSECLTGDVFGSRRCDCGPQLHAAMEMIAAEGCGVVVYLCGHEGRGIGIAHKLRAYELQDQGFDTVDANLELGLPVDLREYGIGAAILRDLGVGSIRLLTNNPAKIAGLAAFGIDIAGRLPLVTAEHEDNAAYLRTKRERLGHRFEHDAEH